MIDPGNRKYKLRRVCRHLKSEPGKMKENLIKRYKRKIKCLSQVQRIDKVKREKEHKKKIQTITPNSLRKYQSLAIFKPSDQFPERRPRIGPFICDPGIKLSREELTLLSKQPKFSVRQNIKDLERLLETGRMLIKHRINENNNRKKEERKKGLETTRREDIRPENNSEGERQKLISSLWDENKDRFIFNPVDKVININRATDYPLNKPIILLKPLPLEDEMD